MQKVVLVIRDMLEDYPPAKSVIYALASLKVPIKIICPRMEQNTIQEMTQLGASIEQVYPKYSRSSNLLDRLNRHIKFRKAAWHALEREQNAPLYWIVGAMTAIAMGKKLRRLPFALHLLELYDRHPRYRRGLAKYANAAQKVVVSESCRAAIQQVWWRLDRKPYVLPNKPIDHPLKRNVGIENPEVRKVINTLSGKRIILYQGHIFADRDLTAFARALYRIGDPYKLVLMGRGNRDAVTKLEQLCPGLIHIPFQSPPAHLHVTSHAHIGIAVYDAVSLNNVFCAPNKIWEYTGFGIPVIGNRIPGLEFTVQSSGAGCCVDMTPSAIESAIQRIEKHYDEFSKNSRRFFDAVDVRAIVASILTDS